MKIIKDITLDLNSGLKEGAIRNIVEVCQGEIDSRAIRVKITKDKKVFPIPKTFSAKVDMSINNVLVAENMPCEINPNKWESSTVYIPVTEHMCSEVGLGVANLKFTEDSSEVIAQKFFILVVDNVTGKSRSIYSEIKKVNKVLSQTVRDNTEPVYLDEERLGQLPEVLDDVKNILSEMGVDSSNLYLNDIPNILKTIMGQYGCKFVSIIPKDGGDNGDNSLSELIDDNYIGVYTLGGNTNSYLFYNIYTPDYNLNEQFKLVFRQDGSDFIFDTHKRECRTNEGEQRVWTEWETYKQNCNSIINIDDKGNYYETKTVEGALQEIGAKLDSIDTALDNIIALQNSYIGGATE